MTDKRPPFNPRDRDDDLYSPRIRSQLIPVLYLTAKAKVMPMTSLVDTLLYKALVVEALPGDARDKLSRIDLSFLTQKRDATNEADKHTLTAMPAPFGNEHELVAWYSGAKQGLFRLHGLYELTGKLTETRRADHATMLQLLDHLHDDALVCIKRRWQ